MKQKHGYYFRRINLLLVFSKEKLGPLQVGQENRRRIMHELYSPYDVVDVVQRTWDTWYAWMKILQQERYSKEERGKRRPGRPCLR